VLRLSSSLHRHRDKRKLSESLCVFVRHFSQLTIRVQTGWALGLAPETLGQNDLD
jgi:hypothetical protein